MNETTLLDRKDFDALALKRDNGRCIMCGEPATAVHHIMERKLWDDGGYYLANAASLCDKDHLLAEQTLISCETLREKAGIKVVLLPEHLLAEEGERYDKWGNPMHPLGIRYRGELWYEENVQKVLAQANLLGDFSKYSKYPRTMHLPWSPNLQNDDRRISTTQFLKTCREIIVTAKLDGENTTLYSDYIHARSVDGKKHDSRTWIKALHGRIKHEIPEDWKICGENMYAQHSIAYDNLESYFYVFNIWERGTLLDWDSTVAYANMLGLAVVPVLYRGPYDETALHTIEAQMAPAKDEGYVLRSSETIPATRWRQLAAKFVREGHVQTDEHWMEGPVIPNKLRKG